jgi:hypothetical protein
LVRQARRHSPGGHRFGTEDDTPTRWPASPSPWRDGRTGGWAALQRDGPQRRPSFPPLPRSATTRRTRSRLIRLQACGPRPTLAVASGASASSLRLTGQRPSPPCHSAAVRPCTTSMSSCPVGRRMPPSRRGAAARCPLPPHPRARWAGAAPPVARGDEPRRWTSAAGRAPDTSSSPPRGSAPITSSCGRPGLTNGGDAAPDSSSCCGLARGPPIAAVQRLRPPTD